MNQLRTSLKAILIGFLGLFLTTCQTDTSLQEMDQILISESEGNLSDINSLELTSNSTVNYLMDLINTIEFMVEDGLLNKGNANALIVKIENAIKSIENGNTNASSGQLNALINEVEDFIDKGTLPVEAGELIINEVETGIILSEGGFVDPNDGYEYSVVLIGDQLWMAENLRTTKFNDGTDIPLIIDNEEWTNLTTPGYCWYNNDPDTYSTTFGGLYNWYTVETGKLCPAGWHVPTIYEVETLEIYLTNNGYGYGGSGEDIAKSLAFTSGWRSFEYEGTPGNDQASNNSTGFSGLAAGLRGGPNDGDGMFYGVGDWAWWWTATESPLYPDITAYDIRLRHNVSFLYPSGYLKKAGLYVRCMRD